MSDINMKMNDVRKMSDDELKSRINELKLDLGIEKRKQVSTGVASKKNKSKEMRRSVAQALTVLRQRGAKL